MVRTVYTENDIIQLTLDNVRSFYNRNPAVTTASMTDDFMWIGSNDFQWGENLKDFYRLSQKEYEEPPVLLSDEEYHVLFHERNVWVVYGRFKIMTGRDKGSVLHAHVRCTFVWRKVDGDLKLAHVHGSHAHDIPITNLFPVSTPLGDNISYFDYMKQMDALRTDGEKIAFRDRDKNYRYLFPSDIIYLKAAAQWSIVYTKTESFQVWGLLAEYQKRLPDMFCRIHKSYLVNSMYIDSIHRYRAVLKSGLELPIGKERYMDLKQFLHQPLGNAAKPKK